MSRFETPVKMKLGDILKTTPSSTYIMDTDIQTVMSDALPIWELLGITEEEYYKKYPPVDLSGNEVSTGPTSPTEPTDALGLTGLTGSTGFVLTLDD